MKADVYNQENKKVGTMDLPDKMFKVKWNPDLVHQVFVAQMSNSRVPYAHTKGRGEVRGGGKKPWRQKHTGRARHGSRRSPIWIGGGVTFGPTKEKNFSKKINKKMKRAALYSLLSKKITDKQFKILDDFNIVDHKTKKMNQILKRMLGEKHSVLIVANKNDKNVFLAARNIPKTKVLMPESLNVLDCLSYKGIIAPQKALDSFIESKNK